MLMPTIPIRPTHIFVPFERVERQEDGSAIVEGYAFVNEAVPGDKYRWKRSAVEAATPDYMRFGNVREMHQPSAAGIVIEQNWDERGWFLRSKVVDTEAAKKCIEGVYKGYSLGIRPLQLRGIEVEKLDVIETSLVDRPKDPDAVFTAYRAEGIDPEAEVDCELLETEERVDEPAVEPSQEAEEPRIAPEDLAALEAQRAAAVAALTPPAEEPPAQDPEERIIEQDGDKWVLWSHDRSKKLGTFDSKAEAEKREREVEYFKHEGRAEDAPEERAQTSATVPVRENVEGKKTCRACNGSGYVPDGDEERVDDPAAAPVAEPEESETISRIAALEADKTALITRAETAEAEIARVAGELETRSGELDQARERITTLERTPATQNRPVLFPQALERDFFVNRANDRSADLAAVREKLAALMAQRPTDPGEQNVLAAQVNLLKQQIASLA